MLVSHMYIVHTEENQECSLGYTGMDVEAAGIFSVNFRSNCLSFMYDFSRLKYLEGGILLNLNSSRGSHTLSNAWLTSKNAAVQYSWFP
jgi:hypothetical protein